MFKFKIRCGLCLFCILVFLYRLVIVLIFFRINCIKEVLVLFNLVKFIIKIFLLYYYMEYWLMFEIMIIYCFCRLVVFGSGLCFVCKCSIYLNYCINCWGVSDINVFNFLIWYIVFVFDKWCFWWVIFF